MFQSIFKRTICKNLQIASNAKCSTISDILIKKDINRVKLVGQVVSAAHFNYGSGHKFLKVKTIDVDGKNENRQIHVLHSTVPYNNKAGQRIFVDGRLESKEIVTFENKRLFKPIIYAIRIYPLNSMTKDNTKLKDVNSVELLASICENVSIKDDHSIIEAITHHEDKTKQHYRSNFHIIFIFDPKLREFVHNNLQKNDRIYVKGSLASTQVDINGNKSQNAYIAAQRIQKIIKK